MMVREFQRVVGIEARDQYMEMTGELPDHVIACCGGGSNAMGILSAFIEDPVRLHIVEPMGRGENIGDNAASVKFGTEGVIHGFSKYKNSLFIKVFFI